MGRGCVFQHAHTGGVCLGRCLPRGVSAWGGVSASGPWVGCTRLWTDTPLWPKADPPPARDGSFSGRYASYWNAFLFSNLIQIVLSIEWNSIRLGGHTHEIVTKTVHKALPRSLFCLSKVGLVQLFPVRSLPNICSNGLLLPLHSATCIFGVSVVNFPGF